MSSEAPILTLNIGSSSLKFALFDRKGTEETRLAAGAATGIGNPAGQFQFDLQSSVGQRRAAHFDDHQHAIRTVFDALSTTRIPPPSGIGHRIVHGGTHHQMHARIDAGLLASLQRAVPFAPLHLPAELEGIETVTRLYPHVVQVACFDTAFHRELPELSRRLPLPRNFYDDGIKRYGFHGLSYEYLVEKLGSQLGERSILAHLGSGASMVALREGKPVETTMGLTPTGGFMSGTRSGDLDPGVLLYLTRSGRPSDELERIVNQESGLRGVSGGAADMRTIVERRADDPHAAQAFDMFCYHARKSIGALFAVLGGIDSLVFTGGIGENAPEVREHICSALDCFGIHLNSENNARGDEIISAAGSRPTVRVVRTNEEAMIARHTRRILALR